MLLLDSNVVSELRKRPDKRQSAFQRWANGLDLDSAYISVLTLYELEVGVVLKETSDPVQGLVFRNWLENGIKIGFADRVLPVDASIIRIAAGFQAKRTIPAVDGLIAATALIHGLTLATRNVKHVRDLGVALFNPWMDEF